MYLMFVSDGIPQFSFEWIYSRNKHKFQRDILLLYIKLCINETRLCLRQSPHSVRNSRTSVLTQLLKWPWSALKHTALFVISTETGSQGRTLSGCSHFFKQPTAFSLAHIYNTSSFTKGRLSDETPMEGEALGTVAQTFKSEIPLDMDSDLRLWSFALLSQWSDRGAEVGPECLNIEKWPTREINGILQPRDRVRPL